jgi:3',5'-cyclic AMP phosphodiesterase CpdA
LRTIAHLSDLHFGREDPRIAEELAAEIVALSPSLVAISGDLTQRARRRQYRAARAFLDRIPFARIVVPGNHDIPLYDLYSRFFRPLHRWRRYIDEEIDPVYEDAEMIVAGVSTARSNVWKGGRISIRQIETVRATICASRAPFAVLVAHHPFTPLPMLPRETLVGRSLRALRAFEECGVHLILTGHLHRGHSGDVRDHYHVLDNSVLTAHASTSISNRRRGEPNSFNFITLSPDRQEVEIAVREWDGTRFTQASSTLFARKGKLWLREAGDPPEATPRRN